MTEPTPRPWEQDGKFVMSTDELVITCLIQHTGEDESLAVANARFIVTAVNCHDELVDALQWFVDRVDKGEVRSKRTYARFKELLAKVRELETGD